MSSPYLHSSLLRPPIIHILRAAGFHSARPSVIETLADLALRYLLLLANTTASCASANNSLLEPQLQDVRMAMEQCLVFRPQMTAMEEEWLGREDMRGVDGFIEWARSDVNREIRRIAGMHFEGEASVDAAEMEKLGAGEDYLTMLKKKHSKTGEESRFQGTVLGKTADDKVVRIEGGPVESLNQWSRHISEIDRPLSPRADVVPSETPRSNVNTSND